MWWIVLALVLICIVEVIGLVFNWIVLSLTKLEPGLLHYCIQRGQINNAEKAAIDIFPLCT